VTVSVGTSRKGDGGMAQRGARRITSILVATLAAVVLAAGTPQPRSWGAAVSEEAPSDLVYTPQSPDAEVEAARAAREAYGLDTQRTDRAVEEGLWNAAEGLFLFDDEVAEVVSRRKTQMSSADVIQRVRAAHPDTFAGGWYDRVDGSVVVAFTSEDTRSSVDLPHPDDAVRVRSEIRPRSERELIALRDQLETHLLGVKNAELTIALIGIHPVENAVMIGVFEDHLQRTDTLLRGVESDHVFVFPVERPDGEQSRAEAGERLLFQPQHPIGFGAQHCTVAGSGSSYWMGTWFYYLITAGHCRDGTAQAPNARQFSHEGSTNLPLWQWFYGGDVDVGKVWVGYEKTSSRLANAPGPNHMRVIGHNPPYADTFGIPVHFYGQGVPLSGTLSAYRTGYTFCSHCTTSGDGAFLHNQFVWSPYATSGPGSFTAQGDSGGPLWYHVGSDMVMLLSINRLGWSVPPEWGHFHAAGTRFDRALPAAGMQLLTASTGPPG
jgi:hypothetical protein